MTRSLFFSLLTVTAAWVLVSKSLSTHKKIAVAEAAEMLREAWADNHTTA